MLTGQIRFVEPDVICYAFAMSAPSPAVRAPSPHFGGEGARTALRKLGRSRERVMADFSRRQPRPCCQKRTCPTFFHDD